VDIAAWLRGLGLERFERAFREGEVDSEVLPELTDADLKELGVPLGPRKKLLKAIAALGGGAEPLPVRERKPTEAERRQLTVLFCDLVGSTAISARLDPEDMREVITAYQNCCAGLVNQFDGHVAKFMGDSVLAYFGYPQAHEDDAERAVRAGLELVRAVARLTAPDGQTLATRVGIDTGLVVVGDLIGQGAAQEEAVVGDTPNRAARLQAAAEPGAVLISANTKRLLGGVFTYDDLGAQALKGFDRPIGIWRVTGLSAVESRFEARSGTGLTPFVGRDEEIALLLRRWQQAEGGEGQVVLLCGEPGIGKSRITSTLRERTADDAQVRMQIQCSPFFTNSAFYPIVAHLERAMRYDADLSTEEKLDRLDALLSRATNDVRPIAPLFASLLAIHTHDRYPPLDLSPPRQKERTIEALIEQIEHLAHRQPVLMVFEDVHWIDPTTLELLDRLVEAIPGWRVLVVITFRPEFSPPWDGHAHVTAYTLNRLARRECGALLDQVTGGKALPEQLRAQIVDKTDGVPLFVEELTKAVVESNLLEDRGDHYALAGTVSMVEVPATLHDSLMARLDRLLPVKEVAQIGAALGREFSYKLIAAVAPTPAAELQDALGRLVASQLVFQRGAPPTATYTFKHALVQDAAYGSMLKRRRQQLHFKVAKALEQLFPETVEAEPELVAHHYTEAEMAEPAIAYWRRAGERAAQQSASAEAVAHINRGLELVRHLPDTSARAEQELVLLNTLAAPLMNTKGYAAPEAVEVYDRARQLCEQVGESIHIFQALAGVSTYHMVRGDVSYALSLAEEMITPAERQNDLGPAIETRRLLGLHSHCSGLFSRALHHFKSVQQIFDPKQRQKLALIYGQDHLMSSFTMGCQTLAALGYPEQAHHWREEAIREAERSGHKFSQAYAGALSLLALYILDEVEVIQSSASQVIALSAEQGFPFYLTIAQICQGWTLARGGSPEDGISQMRVGIEGLRATGSAVLLPGFFVMLASGFGQNGKFPEAFEFIDKSLEQSERWGERWPEAEAYRVKAALLLAKDNPDPEAAQIALKSALEVARNQEAKTWELRAATDLARLWRDQGKKNEARDVLAPTYEWFTEGLGLPTLRAAKEVLDTLH
jgi:predicted ATPase/class 3 adenylate cyclase